MKFCKLGYECIDPIESALIIQKSFESFKLNKKIDNVNFTLNLYEFPPYLKILNGKEIQTSNENNKIPKTISLLHSIAHIEFNAMKSYTDTLLRFVNYNKFNEEIQKEFVLDIFSVASDEARHFTLLNKRLEQCSYKYGDLPVIGAIRETTKDSIYDLKERLALISIYQEGKGLDAGPHLLSILKNQKEKEGSDILQMIINEEINHVAIGFKWFVKISKLNDLDPKEEFLRILKKFKLNLNKSLNWSLRDQTGIPRDWLINK